MTKIALTRGYAWHVRRRIQRIRARLGVALAWVLIIGALLAIVILSRNP